MWLPAMPVSTSLIFASAISSASSSERWMAFTVDSMLTTTPSSGPARGGCPCRACFSVSSGVISAHQRHDLGGADVEGDQELAGVAGGWGSFSGRSVVRSAKRWVAKVGSVAGEPGTGKPREALRRMA
jgi:hypothetical protein